MTVYYYLKSKTANSHFTRHSSNNLWMSNRTNDWPTDVCASFPRPLRRAFLPLVVVVVALCAVTSPPSPNISIKDEGWPQASDGFDTRMWPFCWRRVSATTSIFVEVLSTEVGEDPFATSVASFDPCCGLLPFCAGRFVLAKCLLAWASSTLVSCVKGLAEFPRCAVLLVWDTCSAVSQIFLPLWATSPFGSWVMTSVCEVAPDLWQPTDWLDLSLTAVPFAVDELGQDDVAAGRLLFFWPSDCWFEFVTSCDCPIFWPLLPFASFIEICGLVSVVSDDDDVAGWEVLFLSAWPWSRPWHSDDCFRSGLVHTECEEHWIWLTVVTATSEGTTFDFRIADSVPPCEQAVLVSSLLQVSRGSWTEAVRLLVLIVLVVISLVVLADTLADWCTAREAPFSCCFSAACNYPHHITAYHQHYNSIPNTKVVGIESS